MWNDTWTNGLFNGIEGGVSAILAHRVAVSVVPTSEQPERPGNRTASQA